MSSLATRTKLKITLPGIDSASNINANVISLTYCDKEMGEADDLQIKIEDHDDAWLCKWLNMPVSVAAPAASSGWAIGDAVVASGRPQYSSYGNGAPGREVANHQGKITYLNLKSGIPYPIHVDSLGWFAESQVQRAGESPAAATQTGVKGLKISASIIRENGEGGVAELNCGEFEIDAIEATGPGATISIKCTSLPYQAPVRQTQKNKAWEGYTLSGIQKEIAANNNMACLFESSVDPVIQRAEQVKKSDITFLETLCKRYGLSLKATANMLVIFNQMEYEAKPVVRSISKGDKSYSRYRFRTSENDTQYGACHICYINPANGALIEYTHFLDPDPEKQKNAQTLEIYQKVGSIGEAMDLAQKMLRLKNKF